MSYLLRGFRISLVIVAITLVLVLTRAAIMGIPASRLADRVLQIIFVALGEIVVLAPVIAIAQWFRDVIGRR